VPASLSELLAFGELGVRHILGPDALDHELFLLALAAIYRPRDWRDAWWVVTAFTVGHSLTLALAVTGALRLPMPLIEFLIPVTIVATAVENIAVRDRARSLWRGRYRAVFAGVFGLVHGAGFANYLQSLFIDRIAVPLLGFNLGIELGQIVVLTAAALLLSGADRLIARVQLPGATTPLRLRVVGVSLFVACIAGLWVLERNPWWR